MVIIDGIATLLTASHVEWGQWRFLVPKATKWFQGLTPFGYAVIRMLEAVAGPDCKVGVHSWCAAGCTNFSLPAAALSSGSEAGDSVPWHRTYRCWSKPAQRHCPWSSSAWRESVRVLRLVVVGVREHGRHSPGHCSALGPLAWLECGGQLLTVCALLGVCAFVWRAPVLAASRQCLGPLALLECGGQLLTVCALLGVCVPLFGAHRYSPGYGSTASPPRPRPNGFVSHGYS